MDNREKVITLSSYLSLYLYFFSIIIGGKEMVILLAALFSLPYYAVIGGKYHTNSFWTLLLLLMVIGATINMLVAPNGWGGVLVVLGVFSTSYFICKNSDDLLNHFRLFLIVFIIYISYRLLLRGENPNDIYVGRSRNYIGLVLSLLNCSYSFIYFLNKKKPELIISFISLLLSYILVGRTTMGVMAALFLFNLTTYFKKKRIFLFIIAGVSTVIAIHFWDIIEQYYKMSSFGGFGLDTPRYEIWKAFAERINLGTFIWGMDVMGIAEVREFQGNLHNDFLNVLARTGIGAIALFFFCFLSLSQYLRNREYYCIVVLLIASFRVFFDTGIFVNVLGISFYPLIFYPILNIGNSKRFKYESRSFNVNNEQEVHSGIRVR